MVLEMGFKELKKDILLKLDLSQLDTFIKPYIEKMNNMTNIVTIYSCGGHKRMDIPQHTNAYIIFVTNIRIQSKIISLLNDYILKYPDTYLIIDYGYDGLKFYRYSITFPYHTRKVRLDYFIDILNNM